MALLQVRRDYQALIQSDLFERGKRLRNDAIAHILVPDDPTPTVSYETIYALHDAAERLAIMKTVSARQYRVGQGHCQCIFLTEPLIWFKQRDQFAEHL